MRAERAVLLALAAASLHASAAAGLDLEDGRLRIEGGIVPPLPVHAPYRALVPVAAGEGTALRFDGNSTWGESEGAVAIDLSGGLTISAFVAIASPPVETASVIHLAEAAEGPHLRLAVGEWLEPEFVVGDLRAASLEALPLGRWVHLAGIVDGAGARLYVDGALVAESPGAPPERIEGPLALGRSLHAGARDVHPYGVWNGLLAGVTVTEGGDESALPTTRPLAPPDLSVPAAWRAADPLRPRVHPMPPIGWTNEPHALIRRDGLWHLYHQANPNGAFWDHIVWGHLVSEDLAAWQARPPALVPSTGFDRRGVWVGNWIPQTEPPVALYTGVNGERSGLGRAEMQPDGRLERRDFAVRYDTPEGFQDMRDPFVLRNGDGYLALIGSGTLAHDAPLVLAFASQDTQDWTFLGEFDTGGVEMPGEFWELPVLRPFADRWLLMGTPVIADAEARTHYWLGRFDGVRFVPDDPAPHDFDLFRTLLAPSLADDEDGRTIAIGIVPDAGQRPEDLRRAAGWVHALSLPFALSLCPEDDGRLCAALPDPLRARFSAPRAALADVALEAEPLALASSEEPVLVTGTLVVPEGGEAVLGVLASETSGEVTRLRLRPAEGVVRLDRSAASSAPFAHDDIRTGAVSPVERVAFAVLVDGGAVSGTIAGRPFGVILYPQSADARGLTLAGDGGARVEELRVEGWAAE